MAGMAGVVKVVPVPTAVPPVAVVYQLTVPEDAVAVSVAVLFWQMFTTGVVVVISGSGFIVATTAVRGAVVQVLS